MDSTLEQELIQQVDQLPRAKQVQVLEFARELAGSTSSQHMVPGLHAASDEPLHGQPGSELLKFAGLFPPEDLDEIERAIEEGCESINPHGW
jgi:hypothetical protein